MMKGSDLYPSQKGIERCIWRYHEKCVLANERPSPIVSAGSHGNIVREANAIRFVRTQHNLKPSNDSTADRDVGLTVFVFVKKGFDVC